MSGPVDVSVIMPVCAWPTPADVSGAPHPQLLRALNSVVAATEPYHSLRGVSCELLVGVDGHVPRVVEAVSAWAAAHPQVRTRVECFERSATVTFGNRQRNRFLDQGPAGRLIVWQDQDDQFYPYALTRAVARAEASPGHPLIFKMRLYHNPRAPTVLWQTKGRVECGHIGGHMLVAPNEPGLLGRWELETLYEADFAYISQTLERFRAAGREAVWCDEFISMLRPAASGL